MMKKINGLLSAAAAAIAICTLLAACSSVEENETAENEIPQISVDMSTEAQTTPEQSAADSSDSEENTVSEETAPPDSYEETAAPEETAERTETSIVEEAAAAGNENENADDSVNAGTDESVNINTDEIVNVNTDASGNGVVSLALAQEGKPFYFGGSDPVNGFDNSGLVYYVLNQNGIACPRLTFEIAEMGDKIGFDELQAGDVVFFEYEGSGNADFCGIYIGDGMMMVSTDEDRPVSKVDITTDYYQRTFQYGIKTGR